MKNVLIIVGLLIVLALAFYFTQIAVNGGSVTIPGFGKSAKAVIDNHTYSLTVAETEKEKEIGLSGKKSLAKTSGMVFPFDKQVTPAFWMKDMEFPIDILFIRSGKVVTIFKNVQPPVSGQNLNLYKPTQPIDTVLEINAGQSEANGFKEGDSIQVTL